MHEGVVVSLTESLGRWFAVFLEILLDRSKWVWEAEQIMRGG